MPVEKFKGGGGIIRCEGRWIQRCFYCTEPHTVMCDYPVPERHSKTCDRKTCRAHARRNPDGTDYCKEHDDNAVSLNR